MWVVGRGACNCKTVGWESKMTQLVSDVSLTFDSLQKWQQSWHWLWHIKDLKQSRMRRNISITTKTFVPLKLWLSRSIRAALLQVNNEATANNCENCNANWTIIFWSECYGILMINDSWILRERFKKNWKKTNKC